MMLASEDAVTAMSSTIVRQTFSSPKTALALAGGIPSLSITNARKLEQTLLDNFLCRVHAHLNAMEKSVAPMVVGAVAGLVPMD